MVSLLWKFTLLCLFLLACTSAEVLERSSKPQTPDKDPFYDPPSGWEEKEHGTILRSRKVDIAFFQIAKVKYKEAYEILYRTSRSEEDQPSTTVTTVIVPENAKKDKLVNMNVYVDANGARCVPSYVLQRNAKLATDPALSYQQVLFSTILDEGYILTVPDYQGPKRAFAAGRLEGHMAIDGILATLDLKELGLSKDAKVIGYGYSGGSIATGWAASLQPSYAPNLNMVGWTFGGTPANLTSTLEHLNGGTAAGFAVSGVAGIVDEYEPVADWIDDKLTHKGKHALDFVREHCTVGIVLRYPFTNVLSDSFMKHGAQLLQSPILKKVLGTLNMGVRPDETPKAPVYMFHAKLDEVIPYGSAHDAAKRWGDHGADILFEEFTGLVMGHASTELLNLPNVLLFMRDRMSGKPFIHGYEHKHTDNPLEDPGVIAKGFGALAETIKNAIDNTVGMGDKHMKAKIEQSRRRRIVS